jgi:hypothetical protein
MQNGGAACILATCQQRGGYREVSRHLLEAAVDFNRNDIVRRQRQ